MRLLTFWIYIVLGVVFALFLMMKVSTDDRDRAISNIYVFFPCGPAAVLAVAVLKLESTGPTEHGTQTRVFFFYKCKCNGR